MQRQFFLFSLLLSFFASSFAQEVQWADSILKVSSEFIYDKAPGQYLAAEALGKPTVLPRTGAAATAWCPASEDSSEDQYIRLHYANPIQVQQIAIAENFNPGSISQITLIDTEGEAHNVYANPVPEPLTIPGRLWNVLIDRTPYKVAAVQLWLAVSRIKGFNQIDAVGIADFRAPVQANINLVENMEMTGKPENLGEAVNSVHDELCPVISADGKTLYFTRWGNPDNFGGAESQDIWFSTVSDSGGYNEAKNMGEPLNNLGNNSITSITPDGQTAILIGRYQPDGKMKSGVSMARRAGNDFAMPEPCDIEDYYNDNKYSEFCLSANGKVMLLTIQRKDSYGGKDLCVSFLEADGGWSKPLNMGNVVNTADNETSPFLAADGKTLYYSTAGLPGYGSKDMFISRRLDDSWTNWSAPQNLGPVLNTPEFDAYYSIPASGEYAYFVSYENSFGKADIFRCLLPKEIRPLPVILVKGKVFDAKTSAPLGAGIVYESLTSGKEVGIANSDPRDGSYSIALPAGEDYGFLGETNGYLPVSERLDLREVDEYREVIRDLALVPLESGAVVVMNNLFFDTGKSELGEASRNELRRLAKTLENYPKMTIEIGGHTDDVGTDASNLALSKARANAVRQFLFDAGLPSSRIQAKGYGETDFLVPNDSDENRQRNRRVQFTVLKM